MAFTNFEYADHSSVGNGGIEDHGHLLVGVTATDNGKWFDCQGVKELNVLVDGISTATVQLIGSNATKIPADNTHGTTIKKITTNTQMTLKEEEIPRWAKVRVTAYSSGTINASVKRRRYQI